MIKNGESAIAVNPWTRYPPATAFYHGYLWVEIFFILSGFVLPQNFFKTGRASCLTGGVMRRYFRLMIPVLMILSIYLAFARFDCFGEQTLNKLKNKTFLNLLYAAILETWAGPSVSFIEVTWTLGIEFWATFLVYLIAFTGHAYRGRFFFYTALIFFFWTVEWLGFLNLIPWKTNRPFKQIPFFLIGTALADLENMTHRPLDKIRDLHWGWKIPLNALLAGAFLIWGSIQNEEPTGCINAYGPRCKVYTIASINGFLPYRFTLAAASISAILLALTSDVFQWILKTAPIQFLGQVSYTLYLVHILFVHWIQKDTYNYFVGEGVEADEAVTYVFLIYTPVLFVVSWALEIVIDRPAKEFAGEFDRQTRRNRPKPQPVLNAETGELEQQDPKEFYSCGSFSKRIWPMYFFIGWLLTLAIAIEVFNATHTYKPMRHNTHESSEQEKYASQTMTLP